MFSFCEQVHVPSGDQLELQVSQTYLYLTGNDDKNCNRPRPQVYFVQWEHFNVLIDFYSHHVGMIY